MPITNYAIIGYKRTFPKCLAVNEPLSTLIMKVGTNVPDGYDTPLDSEPVYFPPKELYKELVKADAEAVWLDKATQQPKFIFK